MTANVIRRLRIEGRVQGVGYRAWCVGEAVRLGLSGWVRNRRDGSVEALVQGPETRVSELVERCGSGPRFAKVTSVEAEELAPDTQVPSGFSQAPTL